MQVRRHQEVAADVGIPVEDYEVVSAPVNHQVFRITGWVLLRVTKEAGALRYVGGGFANVFVSPGTPQSFHDDIYRAAKDSLELTTGSR